MTKADLERRIAVLEAQMVDIRHRLESAKMVVPLGCVCPADAQMNCHAAMCPRKPWVTTSAGEVYRLAP